MFLHGEIRLVFPRNQNVALPVFHKRRRRAPCAGIHNQHVIIQACRKILHFGLVPAEFLICIIPGRQEIPARAAGRFRIGRYHLNPFLYQIVPVGNPLFISVPNQKNNRRSIRRAVSFKFLQPPGLN